ncbi:MAG: hypothetical protein AAF657_04700 [Acidobacteriota bacterium]
MSLRGIARHDGTGLFWLLTFILLWLPIGSSWADTAVNTYTTGDQNRSAVAADGQGRFIVVWESEGQDGDGSGIFGRRFQADGEPVGDEFAVNDYTTGDQSQPRVSANTDGQFIVVWQGSGGGASGDVLARRFDAQGVPLDNQFQINEDTSLDQRSPAVALADDGSFLAVWSNEDRLAARRFDELSNPITGDFEIAVNDVYGAYGFRSFHRRDVEALPAGDFVVVWQDHLYTGYGYAYSDLILGAIIDEQSTSVTPFNASSGAPAEQQRSPALAPAADGGFVVVWGGYTDYAAYSRILGRRFADDGTPQGALFDPTPAGYTVLRPEGVAAIGSDRFLVVWNDSEIEGRYIATDGTPLSAPFIINADPSGSDGQPAVASAGRDVMVTWTRDDGGAALDEVTGTVRLLLFFDGFESGGTLAWSAVSP